MESDFLLMVLRGLLPRRPDLRIVLMCARGVKGGASCLLYSR